MTENEKPKKRTRVTSSVSMHKNLDAQVQALAEAENRSKSNMIAQLVKEGIQHRKERQVVA